MRGTGGSASGGHRGPTRHGKWRPERPRASARRRGFDQQLLQNGRPGARGWGSGASHGIRALPPTPSGACPRGRQARGTEDRVPPPGVPGVSEQTVVRCSVVVYNCLYLGEACGQGEEQLLPAHPQISALCRGWGGRLGVHFAIGGRRSRRCCERPGTAGRTPLLRSSCADTPHYCTAQCNTVQYFTMQNSTYSAVHCSALVAVSTRCND